VSVEVQLATTSAAPEATLIERWGVRALREAAPGSGPAREPGGGRRPSDGDVCVRVVGEAESRRLNHEYRHRDAATNVLSFPAGIDLPEALVWGDVVVCADVVAREARAQGKTFEDHFAHMVVHGVLHLLGYDHQTADEAAVMERLEIRVLDGLGISDPYGEG
jgi:probable rRNA maturation factor